ncbi:MAG: hypothetical protein AABX01_05625 [Candidatus Micrarchaeota archaeon]
MAYAEIIKKLVVARLQTMPPNVGFSIGSHGTYTKEELISEVRKETDTGKAIVDMQLEFIKQMPRLSATLSD